MKPLYQSKTFWFNLLMLLIGIAPILAAQFAAVSPDQAVLIDSILATVTGIGNLVLRIWFTDMAIDTPKSRARMVGERMDELQ